MLDPIDAGLDYTYFEVASSICEAVMTVNLTNKHLDLMHDLVWLVEL